MEELPLLELFTRLRQAGLPLGINEYQLVLQSLQAGFGVVDRAALARVCRTLWVKSADEEQIFNYHFDQLIGNLPTPSTTLLEELLPKEKKTEGRRLSRLYTTTLSALFFLSIGVLAYEISSGKHPRWLPNPNSTETISPSASAPSAPSSTATESSAPSATSKDSASQAPTDLNSIEFYLAAVIVLAMLIGGFWFVERRMRHRTNSTSSSGETATIASTAILSSNLIQEIGDEVRVAQVVRRVSVGDEHEWADRFEVNTEFLPVTRRQMKQSWRYLRQLVREGPPTEFDVEATVNRIGQQGMLLDPVFVPRRVNLTRLVMLIDQDGSMVPFHSLSQRLVETAMQGGRLGGANVYYFHNCPTEYLYHDSAHQEAVPVEDWLAQLNKSRTVVLIFSDAGAARGGFNSKRRRLTKMFINDLKQHVRYIAWLNPMPRSRWMNTTAAEIARLVPMFEISRQGLDSAIDVLRGRSANSGKVEM